MTKSFNLATCVTFYLPWHNLFEVYKSCTVRNIRIHRGKGADVSWLWTAYFSYEASFFVAGSVTDFNTSSDH